MKSHARVVVIGGGIAGLSALYHLTKEGWTDVVLNHALVGSITSAAWGYRVGTNVAMADILPEHNHEGTTLVVTLVGKRVATTICAPCLHDVHNRIPRGLS